jgi:hypothetical protein
LGEWQGTDKTHISRIFAKLGVQSRAEAVTMALHAAWCRSVKHNGASAGAIVLH